MWEAKIAAEAWSVEREKNSKRKEEKKTVTVPEQRKDSSTASLSAYHIICVQENTGFTDKRQEEASLKKKNR